MGSNSTQDVTGSTDRPVIETQGLTRRFGAFTAVDSVDLGVTENEIHSIIGPNGAGKTTLFNMLAGSLEPSDGRVRFRGQDITSTPMSERALLGISRAYQITQLFPNLSIEENLRIAAQSRHQKFNPINRTDDRLEEEAFSMLEAVDIDAAPSTEASSLSHGDKKKLEIGMSLITDPDLLLLDEPTSGVSENDSHQVMEFLSDVTEDMTVLLIEHDVDMVLSLSDQVTVLHQGSIIEQGTPDTITESEAVQRAYLRG
jgi:branched-chain amino acid transport system ATP-binding protein